MCHFQNLETPNPLKRKGKSDIGTLLKTQDTMRFLWRGVY